MFKSFHGKNILKTSALLSAQKSCYIIKSFILNNNSAKKNINIQQALFFLFQKKASTKKND